MISGLFNASIDGGITFDTLSVTTWNYAKLNPDFRPTISMKTRLYKHTAILLPLQFGMHIDIVIASKKI